MSQTFEPPAMLPIGVAGLDEVLNGGLTPHRMYLIEGTPGTGKTTLGLSFLLSGHALGESCLYITLAETELELRAVGVSHGWSLDGLQLFEMVPADGFGDDHEQTLLHPSEVELGETVRAIMQKVDELRPSRVVLDSLSELRLLAQSPIRYRRQILALKHFFSTRECTVLFLDDKGAEGGDLQLHSIAHGVVSLDQTLSSFGGHRRRLHIVKMRGVRFNGGYHDFEIHKGGLRVFPRLVASDHVSENDDAIMTTGSAQLDALIGGGMVAGTATLLTGPAGVGKTTACVQCMFAALERGERTSYFLFDERAQTLLSRCAALGLDLRPYIENGQLQLRTIDPAEMSPGEFSSVVQSGVEGHGATIVVIDSLNAYLQAMPNEQFLILQMHEMLSYLGNKGIVSLLILGLHGVTGDIRSDVDLSYLSDTVIQLRYFEAQGEVRQAISVIKTRTARHERTIREFQIGEGGLNIGRPLRGFQGVLTGVPRFAGDGSALMDSQEDSEAPGD